MSSGTGRATSAKRGIFPQEYQWRKASRVAIIVLCEEVMLSLGLTYGRTEDIAIYAGFWIRVLAKIIDWLVLSLCLLPFDIFFGTSLVRHPGGLGPEGGMIVFAVFFLYSALMESSRWQATIGKRLAGIVVQDSNGYRMSFVRALGRAGVQVFTTIDYFFVLFTSRKRALHDLVAETVVVYGTAQ